MTPGHLPVGFGLILEVVHVTARFRILRILGLSPFCLCQVQQVTMVLNNKLSLCKTFNSKYSSSFFLYVFDLLTSKCLIDLAKMTRLSLFTYFTTNISAVPTADLHTLCGRWLQHFKSFKWYLHAFFGPILYQIIYVFVLFTLVTVVGFYSENMSTNTTVLGRYS